MTDPSTPLQMFNRLLGEAHAASRVADEFDVHSEDPASKAKWRALRWEQSLACLALVGFVSQHAKELMLELGRLDD